MIGKQLFIGCLAYCKQKCTTHTPYTNKNHPFKEIRLMQKILNQTMSKTEDDWADIFINISSFFSEIKTRLAQIQKKFQQEFYKVKIAATFSLQNSKSIAIMKKFQNGQFNDLTCHQIHQIYGFINSVTPMDPKMITQKANTIYRNINAQINKIEFNFKINNQKTTDFTVEKPSTNQKNTKIRYQQEQSSFYKKMYQDPRQRRDNRNSERVNERVNKIPQMVNKIPQIANKIPQMTHKLPERVKDTSIVMQTVESVDKLNTSCIFNIVLKVIQIKKTFDIGDTKKLQFIAGDQTGIATCVVTFSDLIEEGKVLQLTNCRIYLFHQKIKQIQSNKNSTVMVSRQNIQVNSDFNLSARQNGKPFSHRKDQKDKNKRQRAYRGNRSRANRQQRYRGQKEDTENTEDRGDRGDREDRGGRGNRGDRGDRGDRRQRGNRFQQNEQQKSSKAQKYYNAIQPQMNKKRQAEDESKPTIKCTSIGDILPGDEGLNIIAQISQIVSSSRGKIRCVLGDGTGIVNALLKDLPLIEEGHVVMICGVESNIVNERIQIEMNGNSTVAKSSVKFPVLKFNNNISQKLWIQQYEDD